MVWLRRQGFPAPRPMASRQVVLLTPLESPQPPLSPSCHLINLVNTKFPVVDPLSFQTLTGVHFATHLFSSLSRNGGGPLLMLPSRLTLPSLCSTIMLTSLPATFTNHPTTVANKGLAKYLSPLNATLT